MKFQFSNKKISVERYCNSLIFQYFIPANNPFIFQYFSLFQSIGFMVGKYGKNYKIMIWLIFFISTHFQTNLVSRNLQSSRFQSSETWTFNTQPIGIKACFRPKRSSEPVLRSRCEGPAPP